VTIGTNKHMKHISPSPTALAAVLLSIAFSPASAGELADGPEDLTAAPGDTVTFSVEPRLGELTFQWFRWNVNDYVELSGETNRTLTLTNVGIPDVTLYLCRVAQADKFEFSRAAALCVVVHGAGERRAPRSGPAFNGSMALLSGGGDNGAFTLYGPVIASGGTQSTCPGAYAGYVIYIKSGSLGWGWVPSTNTTYHAATDLNRSDTTLTYSGKYFDSGCAQTTVVLPDPAPSPKYRFAIFFPDNVPGTNAYPITLEGFEP